MKEILEKFGASEFFAYICPGVILLTSLALWTELHFGSLFWKQQALVIILVLIISYILGLMLASFNDRAQAHYPHPTSGRGRVCQGWQSAIRLPDRFPASPSFARAIVEANLVVAQDLERLSGISGLSSFASPWDRLVIYRALKAGRVGDKGLSILVAADTYHRRCLFCMGMALALLLVAIQSLLRFLLLILPCILGSWHSAFPPVSSSWLIVLGLFGVWASFELRQVAIRLWGLERYLTASLSLPEMEKKVFLG